VARHKQPCDMDMVSVYRVVTLHLTARTLSVETPFNLTVIQMTDDQLICRVAADAAEDRLAQERNWTTSPHNEYGNLLAELERVLPNNIEVTRQQIITQWLRLRIAQYRAMALVADDAHWRAISEEAMSILASKNAAVPPHKDTSL